MPTRAEATRRGVARDAAALGGEERAREAHERRYQAAFAIYDARVGPQARAHVVVGNDDPDADALGRAARALADQGRFRWRGEAFDVRSDRDGAVLGQVDRGALPLFGVWAHNVHLNGLVRRGDGLHVWVARRAAHKEVGPGKLDHLAAGGVPAGLTPEEALVKEAAEEAGVPAALGAGAVPVAVLSYAMQRPEGLRRETMHCVRPDRRRSVPSRDRRPVRSCRPGEAAAGRCPRTG